MRNLKFLSLASVVAAMAVLPACTHLKGVVVDEATGRPVPTAFFTVGRSTGVGVSETHHVDALGHFDFTIFPVDEDFLFVWDGTGDSEIDQRRVYKSEMSDNMKVKIRQAMPGPG